MSIFFIYTMVQIMSILDAGQIFTFSSVRANVTYEGEPVKGAKVSRLAKWKDTHTDVTVTSDVGFFEFPAIFQKSITKFMPIEIVITQVITVEYNGIFYKIWINTKMNSDQNTELGGLPLDMECELTDDPVFYENFGPLLETNCRWMK